MKLKKFSKKERYLLGIEFEIIFKVSFHNQFSAKDFSGSVAMELHARGSVQVSYYSFI